MSEETKGTNADEAMGACGEPTCTYEPLAAWGEPLRYLTDDRDEERRHAPRKSRRARTARTVLTLRRGRHMCGSE